MSLARPTQSQKHPFSFGSMRGLVVFALMATVAVLAFGCEKEKSAKPPADKPSKPTLRVYAFAGAAGAVEPCGCVKDMLGGIDHAASFIEKGRSEAPHSLVVGAGPMFFEDPAIEESRLEQSRFKAQAMAESLKDVGLLAWAPGANDWAMGGAEFTGLTEASGALALGANLPKGAGPVVPTHVQKYGDLIVGLVGISLPDFRFGKPEFEPGDVSAAEVALKKGLQELEKKGAQIKIALIAAQRGQALRLIEKVPSFQLAVLGKAFDRGEANDPQFSPEVIGKTLVVQAPNHLQGVSVVDLFVRGEAGSFHDGSGLKEQDEKQRLEKRIEDLAYRINDWKKPDSGVKKSDVQAREKELEKMKKELAAFIPAKPPTEGNYFLYDLVEVREKHGENGDVASRLVAYYRKVNDHNKKKFADRKPEPAAEGDSSYIGVEACSNCHLEERAVWDKTGHAGAYETLEKDHKEFNLDCVSCHVTGYEKPGGSTVTYVEKLSDVQCEVCHGPGSRHAENPADRALIRRSPPRSLCASSCHHAPHVGDDWSVDEAWPHILGPGHGR